MTSTRERIQLDASDELRYALKELAIKNRMTLRAYVFTLLAEAEPELKGIIAKELGMTI
jgi:hypothetical protein